MKEWAQGLDQRFVDQPRAVVIAAGTQRPCAQTPRIGQHIFDQRALAHPGWPFQQCQFARAAPGRFPLLHQPGVFLAPFQQGQPGLDRPHAAGQRVIEFFDLLAQGLGLWAGVHAQLFGQHPPGALVVGQGRAALTAEVEQEHLLTVGIFLPGFQGQQPVDVAQGCLIFAPSGVVFDEGVVDLADPSPPFFPLGGQPDIKFRAVVQPQVFQKIAPKEFGGRGQGVKLIRAGQPLHLHRVHPQPLVPPKADGAPVGFQAVGELLADVVQHPTQIAPTPALWLVPPKERGQLLASHGLGFAAQIAEQAQGLARL